MDCELQDLGFESDVYTWRNNNQRAQGYVRERRPVIILIERKEVRRGGGRKAFFFEVAWLEEEKCEEVVKEG